MNQLINTSRFSIQLITACYDIPSISLGQTVERKICIHRYASKMTPLTFCLAVIGCADPPIVANGLTVIRGHEATIHCNDTDETWRLTCVGMTWLGFPSNCTPPLSELWCCPCAARSVCIINVDMLSARYDVIEH